jgi:hypothetical protein
LSQGQKYVMFQVEAHPLTFRIQISWIASSLCSIASSTISDKDLTLVLEDELPIFHEGPVLFDDALFFTTNRLGETNNPGPVWGSTAPPQLDQFIEIKKLNLTTLNLTTIMPAPDIVMANGMTKTVDGQKMLVLSQGFDQQGAAIYEMDPDTLESDRILDTFYGAKFNSMNDIKVTDDDIIFFSDPVYGFERKSALGSVFSVSVAILNVCISYILYRGVSNG